ncbi:MAG: HAD-IA family hydrolase [Acidobacteriota bacterium]|jgi:pseudouridine-5'-monophosphatase|nr:HAD-IA family hydrolase [Acidobacteriota bacterium]
MPEITHVIYDNDGLLLDTEPFYTAAHGAVAARYGKTFDWSVKGRVIGLRAEDSARIVIDALRLPLTVPEYLEARRAKLEELFPQAEPLPGAVRLTRHLARLGVPQAVATSADRPHFELKVTRHREWYGVFDLVVTGDDPDVGEGKPAPDIFLLAAARMGAEPGRCLVLEDSPAGVAAARAAGMYAVAVPDPHMDRAEYGAAHEVLDSLERFDPARWGFAPF